MAHSILKTKNLKAWYGQTEVIKGISIEFPKNEIVAIMGPSGCGKSTFIRCLNRLHELSPEGRMEGEILLHKKNIMEMPLVVLRQWVGMVFQRPNPFPTMTIFQNVIAGYTLNAIKLEKSKKEEIVQKALESANLWDEVKDSLHKKGNFLSGGQQQRLCIARAIAMKPKVLLLDEPTSALDPMSSARIEELLKTLKEDYTVILVTHNMQQAERLSDKTAFFYLGELMEYNNTKELFKDPKNPKTKGYLKGKFS